MLSSKNRPQVSNAIYGNAMKRDASMTSERSDVTA